MRKNPLVNNEYYHIFNRSIAGYTIFNNDIDYDRMLEMLNFYRFIELPCSYSKFTALTEVHQKAILRDLQKSGRPLVEIVAYCLMLTHFHLILKQLEDGGIVKFMTKILDSYSKYFNVAHNRKGPLWEGRFRSVLIDSDEYMIHLTRYIHLNAVSADLVEKPEKWPYSSYEEYLGKSSKPLCRFNQIMEIEPKIYKKFVLDRAGYQRELSKIKHLLFEDYAG